MVSWSKHRFLIMGAVLALGLVALLALRYAMSGPSDPRSFYNPDYFRGLHAGSLSSAKAVVPLVVRFVHAGSVIDLGCGDGSWLSVFAGQGAKDIRGVDGVWMQPSLLQIPRDSFQASDLRKPFRMERTFDLAVSLEVAEHLPPQSAETFVESLAGLAPVVLFSASIPHSGPGNHYHLNEQWPHYWAEKFAQRQYVPVDCLRDAVWDSRDVEPWYKETIVLFVRRDRLASYPLLAAEYEQRKGTYRAVVHPETLSGVLESFKEPPLRYILPRLPGRIFDRIVQKLRGTRR